MATPDAETLPEDATTLADELAEDADAGEAHEPEATTADEPEPRTPFYTVNARGLGTVAVQAGWLTADGDVHSLAIDVAVGVEQAAAAQSLALSWYQRMLAAIYSQQAEDPEADGGEA